MKDTYWKHLEHKADIGIQGVGPSPELAFAQAGIALMAVVCDPDSIERKTTRTVKCRGSDLEMLFYDFINELIYLISGEGFVYSHLEVQLDDHGLKAEIYGEPLESTRHSPAVEVKGASFSGLKVFPDHGGLFKAQCIVDV